MMLVFNYPCVTWTASYGGTVDGAADTRPRAIAGRLAGWHLISTRVAASRLLLVALAIDRV